MFLGYVKLILDEVIKLRCKYNTLKKARKHAKKILPTEPCSLVEKYLQGSQKPAKEDVVAAIRTHFSKPALPAASLMGTEKNNSCSCKGKCATKKCRLFAKAVMNFVVLCVHVARQSVKTPREHINIYSLHVACRVTKY
jgi:hypothetical protein